MNLIGIPTLNGPDRLGRILASIIECTDLTGTRVLVADDCSTEENLIANKRILHAYSRYGIDMLTSPLRSGVSATWNRLVRHCPDAKNCFIVNDDVEVVPDWFDVLLYSLRENPTVGMVGLNCYVGVTKGQVPQGPRIDYHEAHLTDGGGSLLISGGALFAFRRAVYEQVGGFDERYFCFYEEVDFGVALRRAGYTNVIASYPLVYHMGGATTSNPLNLDAQAHIRQSRAKFLEKWGKTPDVLRQEFLEGRGPVMPVGLYEWNTQLKFLRE